MKKVRKTLLALAIVTALTVGIIYTVKYRTSDTMVIPIEEVSLSEYPDDPSTKSMYYSMYGDRELILKKLDDSHFDFIFTSKNPNVATITLRNIDMSLIIPATPEWIQGQTNLEIIALSDREWNRQQVRFKPDSPEVEIKGGNGLEAERIVSIELARNCLNAGLCELLLYTKEYNKKSLYYQGWFTFPLGHYKKIFENLNNTSYWRHWYRLEHWLDPAGTHVNLSGLRDVISEKEINVDRLPNEQIIVAGEQKNKSKLLKAPGVNCWGDFCEVPEVKFASFIKPGRYSNEHPWDNEYERIATIEKGTLRKIKSPSVNEELDEIELVFRSSRNNEPQKLVISGIKIDELPQIPEHRYPEGLYMPMGISVPPFYQDYEELIKTPPYLQPYFALLLDKQGDWINHHEVAIDGPVIHRDAQDPNKLHLYLLSYERHSLVGHFIIEI